ncbi:MAG: alpha/beta hydrolase [Solobacterium sp.]|nr:alpha/beta hydrolase [Solobacterium sp.]
MIITKMSLSSHEATLTSYLHEDEKERNAILILPGGAYRYCAPGEGEPVAKAFFEEGFQTFVLEYSTIDGLFGSPKVDVEHVYEHAIIDVQDAFAYLQEHGEELHIRKDQIGLVGFSAGANLAFSSYVVGGVKPYCFILGYGVYREETMRHLGIEQRNLIHAITEDTPPAFLFLCQGDSTVPSMESLELAKAYAEKKVPYELHVYVTGDHGLSLGTKESGVVNKDYATWLPHAISFINHIGRDTSLLLGDIEEDLKELSIRSRIGALMYHEEAWTLIEEYLPDIAFRAKTDSHIRSVPLQRVYQWGIVQTPTQEEMDQKLKALLK